MSAKVNIVITSSQKMFLWDKISLSLILHVKEIFDKKMSALLEENVTVFDKNLCRT